LAFIFILAKWVKKVIGRVSLFIRKPVAVYFISRRLPLKMHRLSGRNVWIQFKCRYENNLPAAARRLSFSHIFTYSKFLQLIPYSSQYSLVKYTGQKSACQRSNNKQPQLLNGTSTYKQGLADVTAHTWNCGRQGGSGGAGRCYFPCWACRMQKLVDGHLAAH
jgi:hypothetical protein